MDEWHAVSDSANPPSPAYEENGRLYHGSYRGLYLMPCDEIESDRLTHLHRVIRMARRKAGIPGPQPIDPKAEDYRELHATKFGGLFWASGPKPRILDLGCGTGIWAIEMAVKYPRIEVVGIDIVNIYPDRKISNNFPQGCHFQKGAINFEIPWDMGADHWNFIRLGSLCGSVLDWTSLYQKIHYHLMSGHGIIEQVEIDLRPRCDDGSLPDDVNHPLIKWYQLLCAATAQTGRPIEYDRRTKQILEAVGFVDVCDYVVQLPLNENEHPHGKWPSTPSAQKIARNYHGYLVADATLPGSRNSAFEAMSLAAFTRELGWTYDQWVGFQKEIIDAISRSDLQVYHELHIITGRKPNKYDLLPRSF